MRLHRRLTWYFLVAGLWLTAFAGCWFVWSEYHTKQSVELVTLVACGSAMLALTGWLVQATLAVRIGRKQHSINVLFQSRLSKELTEHLSIVNEKFPHHGPLRWEIIDAAENKAVYNAAVHLLNYYEFIAVAIEHGDMDEGIIRDCILMQFLGFVGRATEMIGKFRGEDEHGVPQPELRQTMSGIVRMRKRWLAARWLETGDWPSRA